MKYSLWMEGYSATGGYSPARHLGVWEAESFGDAVEKWNAEKNPGGMKFGILSKRDEAYYVWGCRIFDNESDARVGFG